MQLKSYSRAIRITCCTLAFITLCVGIWMMIVAAGFSARQLPRGIRSPGVGMELVRTAEEIYQTLGAPSDQSTAARNDRDIMLRLQALDRFPFIVAYALFFAAVGTYAFTSLAKTRWSGIAVVLLALAAAVLDYFEDHAIVLAVNKLNAGVNLADTDATSISSFGYLKWALLFAMLLFLCPLFFRKWPESAALRILGFLTGLYIAFSGVAGELACAISHAGRVESAASALAAPVLFFFPFVALLYHGTLKGLDGIANAFRSVRIFGYRPFSWIVDWPDYGQH